MVCAFISKMQNLAVLRVLLACGAVPAAAVDIASLFYGGAVLQRGTEVNVWGTSTAKRVSLSIDGEQVAEANVETSTGAWKARLPARDAAFHSKLAVQDSSGTVTVPVSFGDVLLCSGQSNMQMPVGPMTRPGFPNGTGFAALNGTAESAAAGRYTDRIWFASAQAHANWNNSGKVVWNSVTPKTLPQFSAVCWYSGRALFDHLGGAVPVGLMVGSVGGSPIEFWIPPESIAACGKDDPPCDTFNNKTDSEFFNEYIAPLQPYTIGAVIWDQGERDVYCYPPAGPHTDRYPCLERQLIQNWRAGFQSSFAFVAVQLPGYIGDCDPHFTNYSLCVPGVFNMRLAQEAGLVDDSAAAIVATYDHSCPAGVQTPGCPFGSVHPLDKATVGSRVALQLRRLLLHEDLVSEGPRASHVSATQMSPGEYVFTVTFDGRSAPLTLQKTAGCDDCCSASDFDVSADGVTWVNTSTASVAGSMQVRFKATVPGSPLRVRYTANRAFPQCAVYNYRSLPALPFDLKVSLDEVIVV